jgi:outer membrane biosynthesis protein TonB
MTAKHVIQQHYEMTELIIPTTPPPPEQGQATAAAQVPPPPEPPKVELQPKQIEMPKPKPEPKPVQMEAKVNCRRSRPSRRRDSGAAAQGRPDRGHACAGQQVKPSTAPVHLGETFGVTPNPNATRPATVAAIGNPYGGMQGPAVAPHGVVGSTGIGNGPSPAPTPAFRRAR